jgi:hypothetical protein
VHITLLVCRKMITLRKCTWRNFRALRQKKTKVMTTTTMTTVLVKVVTMRTTLRLLVIRTACCHFLMLLHSHDLFVYSYEIILLLHSPFRYQFPSAAAAATHSCAERHVATPRQHATCSRQTWKRYES